MRFMNAAQINLGNLLAVGLPLIFGDKMKTKSKMNCALWVAGGSMAGGGFPLHVFFRCTSM